ncbi:hypothetical protein Tco_0549113 [Tanacetum coccineum]
MAGIGNCKVPGTKPGEPRSSGIPEFFDPMSKQRLDEYSRIILEKHVENERKAEIDENSSKSPLDDFEVHWDPGVSMPHTRAHLMRFEMQILKKQNDDLKKKMDDKEGSCKGSKSSELTS